MKIYNMKELLDALKEGREEGHTTDAAFGRALDREYIRNYLAGHGKKAERMKELAAGFARKEIKSLRYSAYAQFDTTGERNDYQDMYFEHRDRMSVMGMCAWLFERESDYRETEDILWAVCEESTWCLPAHLGGRSLEYIRETGCVFQNGKIQPGLGSQRHKLDLFSCETARDMAEILYLTGNAISPFVRKRAMEEITERVFSQYMAFGRMPHFEVDQSNWSAVCGGSVGVAALFLIEEEEMLAPVIQRALSDLDVFISSYGKDGICREGVGYWNYGFYNFSYLAWFLRERTGGRIDLFKEPEVKQAAFFPSRAFLYENSCVNFSDCENRGGCAKDLCGFLKEMYPDMPEITGLAVPEVPGGSRNIPITLRKVIWPEGNTARKFRERSDYFPDAEWLISCRYWRGRAMSCAIRGGE